MIQSQLAADHELKQAANHRKREEKYFELLDALKAITTKSNLRKFGKALQRFEHDMAGMTVMAFTHDVRRREVAFSSLPRGTGKAPQPVQGVHLDFTPRSAEQRLRMILPAEDLPNILKCRW
ncbi:uncharacterized protein LY89DRAFT_98930 [Mollisia scopiformis]|uniref:Uncharacterized protein n=1 Tax=Mollisia scopiformis TaxID=149040 RepID=A0A194X757_MOLSC|nr:uncharacterized protein LY89DRAFT_98930 [Mollisia scopiformis]KUJ15914.1 hypothetical protein LY89DRAFT_98930 [Mollisia scopiformis]